MFIRNIFDCIYRDAFEQSNDLQKYTQRLAVFSEHE